MTEHDWRQVQAILMTSEPIRAYGGVAFAVEALQQAADSLNAGGVPMHLDHDQSKPLRTRAMRAWVDRSENGEYHVLRISYEVHAEDWEHVGERRGMSAAMHVPLAARQDVIDGAVDPDIRLSADAAWFTEEDLIVAEAAIVSRGIPTNRIETTHLYQFSLVPDPQIFVEVLLPLAQAIGYGVLGNAIWDGVKLLFVRRRTPEGGDSTATTRVNIAVSEGDRSLKAIVETTDEAVAQEAIGTLGHAIQDFQGRPDRTDSHVKTLLVWDGSSRKWKERPSG